MKCKHKKCNKEVEDTSARIGHEFCSYRCLHLFDMEEVMRKIYQDLREQAFVFPEDYDIEAEINKFLLKREKEV